MKLKNKSWRTSLFGIAAIVWGVRLACTLYVSNQTLYFNLVYAWQVPTLFILVGIGLIHARDYKCKDE